MIEHGFRGPQVCSLTGCSYRQLDYWCRTGIIAPSISQARGSGTQRRFSVRDVLEVRVICELLEAGVSLQAVRHALPALRLADGSDPDALFVIMGKRALVTTAAELGALLATRPGVAQVIPLGTLAAALHDDLVEHQRRLHVA